MDGLVNFSVAFLLVAFAVVVLMGKADFMMGKYRLTVNGGKLKFVKYRSYNPRRARPLFALMMLCLAVFVVLEYVFRPIPEWCALIPLGVVVPMALYVELRCRQE